MSSPVVHWEIAGKSESGLVEFYSRLFGWQVNTENPEYGLVEGSDGGIGGGIMSLPESVPAYVTIYVQVDDLEGAIAKAAELGGGLIRPPEAIPGVGRFALIRDPEGNVIGLLGE